MSALQELLDISSAPISPAEFDADMFGCLSEKQRRLVDPLKQVLLAKNGFGAFKNALLVLPATRHSSVPGAIEWNSTNGWRRYYEESLPECCFFFGQDLLAGQFGLTESGVVRLEPESGELSLHSDCLESWAKKILGDCDYETGYSLGKDWQSQNGPLGPEIRLVGKLPFILGGDYVTENLVAIATSDAMMKLGHLYQQVKDVPDGERITIHGWIA